MKICYYGKLWIPVMKELEKNGHTIIYNQFSKDANIVLLEGHNQMYKIYPILKKIKKYKIKFVNILIDLPPWRLSIEDNQNYKKYLIKLILQYFYHIIHKHYSLNTILIHLLRILKKHKLTQKLFQITNNSLNTLYKNRIYYQVNYPKFLKKSNLNLSISKFTQFCYKKLANIDSKVCYMCIDSNFVRDINNLPIKYDMINISGITARKRQNLIVDASKKLNLKLIIIGYQKTEKIKLDCLHFYIPNHLDVMKKLKQSYLYIDASIFEGFGMTPIEAAFLDKIVIASDTYIHKEILGNYPLYFIKDNLDDLTKKINQALNNNFQIDKKTLNQIKKKYSIESANNRLENFLCQL